MNWIDKYHVVRKIIVLYICVQFYLINEACINLVEIYLDCGQCISVEGFVSILTVMQAPILALLAYCFKLLKRSSTNDSAETDLPKVS